MFTGTGFYAEQSNSLWAVEGILSKETFNAQGEKIMNFTNVVIYSDWIKMIMWGAPENLTKVSVEMMKNKSIEVKSGRKLENENSTTLAFTSYQSTTTKPPTQQVTNAKAPVETLKFNLSSSSATVKPNDSTILISSQPKIMPTTNRVIAQASTTINPVATDARNSKALELNSNTSKVVFENVTKIEKKLIESEKVLVSNITTNSNSSEVAQQPLLAYLHLPAWMMIGAAFLASLLVLLVVFCALGSQKPEIHH